MATENLTAEQALDEVLDCVYGSYPLGGWREKLRQHEGVSDASLIGGGVTLGDLRRWSAPLREKE